MSLIGNVSIFKTLPKTWLCVDCSDDISSGRHFGRVHYFYLCGGFNPLFVTIISFKASVINVCILIHVAHVYLNS